MARIKVDLISKVAPLGLSPPPHTYAFSSYLIAQEGYGFDTALSFLYARFNLWQVGTILLILFTDASFFFSF